MSRDRSRLGRILHSEPGLENQLTEVVALLLESDSGFASRAVHHLAKLKPSGEVGIHTQKHEKHGLKTLRPDIQVKWPGGLVWVEVKRDMRDESNPTQLSDYRDALKAKAERTRAHEYALVYLTRAGVPTPPDADIHHDWIRFANWLKEDASPLARDLATYLEEERLDVKPLTDDSIRLMNEVEEVRQTFTTLFEHTYERVRDWAEEHGFSEDEHWPRGRLKQEASWFRWWHTLRPPEDGDWHSGLLFEWNLLDDSRRNYDRKFAAGLTIGDETTRAENVWSEEYADSLVDFEVFERLDGYDRLWRTWAVQDLLVGDGTLPAQAEELSKRVIDSFDALIQAGPPGSQ